MSDALPRQASWWDHSRNSSAVYGPLPNALPDALRALRIFRESQPDLAAWIKEGAPVLTAAEHYARFGEDYDRPKRKKAS